MVGTSLSLQRLEIQPSLCPPCLADLSTPYSNLASLATLYLEGLLSAVRNLGAPSEGIGSTERWRAESRRPQSHPSGPALETSFQKNLSSCFVQCSNPTGQRPWQNPDPGQVLCLHQPHSPPPASVMGPREDSYFPGETVRSEEWETLAHSQSPSCEPSSPSHPSAPPGCARREATTLSGRTR